MKKSKRKPRSKPRKPLFQKEEKNAFFSGSPEKFFFELKQNDSRKTNSNESQSEKEIATEKVNAHKLNVGLSPVAVLNDASTSVQQSSMTVEDKGEEATTTSSSKLNAEIAKPTQQEEPEAGSGEVIRMPDIIDEEINAIEQFDSIASSLTYSGSPTRGGATPSGFGVTRSSYSLSGITVRSTPGSFVVAATLNHSITYQIRSSRGPDGQINITSSSDPSINQRNYNRVARNLRPNMSDLNGRPSRTKFWSSDLTLRHERFHANEYRSFGSAKTTVSQGWLNRQTASDEAGVRTLLRTSMQRTRRLVNANMAVPHVERRAYGDGAPSYRARSRAIKSKGDSNKYPA